jgi:hypothetical protein
LLYHDGFSFINYLPDSGRFASPEICSGAGLKKQHFTLTGKYSLPDFPGNVSNFASCFPPDSDPYA